MKKIKKFLLSFIIPTKIGDYRDVSVFLALIVFLACILVAIGPSNLMAKSSIEKNLPNYLIYNEMYQIDDTNQTGFDQIAITVSDEGAVTVFNLIKDDATTIDFMDAVQGEQTYEYQLAVKDSTKKLNLTVVCAPKFYIDENNVNPEDENYAYSQLVFDLQGYYDDQPSEDECNVLLIFTKYYVFYLYNNGIYPTDNTRYLESDTHSVYEKDADGNVCYYYPSTTSEALAVNAYGNPDTTKWTHLATGTDDDNNQLAILNATLKEDATYQSLYGSEGIKSAPRVGNLYEVFENTMGYLSYMSMDDGGFPYALFNINDSSMGVNFGNVLISRYVSAIRTYNYLYSFLYMLILPLIWVLVIWLFSKRNGELTYFREYYNVAAFSFVVPSIFVGIASFFLPYYLIAMYGMIIQIAFYAFVTFRINLVANKTKAREKANEKDIIDIPANVKTNPLPKYEENPQDNSDKTARIG